MVIQFSALTVLAHRRQLGSPAGQHLLGQHDFKAVAWAVALAAVVVAASVLGFTKAETERIWLFLVPFACVAAAPVLRPRRLAPVLGALAAQALAVELLLFTVW